MEDDKYYIRFDYALKKVLRDKANFVVLEGFLTVLLGEKIKIKSLLESEGNREHRDDKTNRVDILAEDTNGALFIIEVQATNEYGMFQRMLFATSKAVTDYIKSGEEYERVKRIYSINIVYFDLGVGDDIIYKGTTEFYGVNNGDKLNLKNYQIARFNVDSVSKLFPIYYIIKVDNFNKVAETPLEEWVSYLKTGDIPDTATAPGLPEARESLDVYKEYSRRDADFYFKDLVENKSIKRNMELSKDEGMFYGRQEGFAVGLEEGIQKGIQQGLEEGMQKGMQKGLEEGMQKGLEKGMQKGMQKGLEEGIRKEREESKKRFLKLMENSGISQETIDDMANKL
ncbi:MAG: Rpn family recombination-promoting nuclease/putative transposase [Bacteroidales bacterium]|nr:Rpn family recombination-promoting nuclease/putative transposase [Bacteroidales bacterium]